VIDEEQPSAGYILGEAEREGVDVVDDVDVVAVVDAHLAYFEAIAAVGQSGRLCDDIRRPEAAPDRRRRRFAPEPVTGRRGRIVTMRN